MSGFIFYRGPSQLDGKPIVGIAVYSSHNRKTGGLVQTYIIREDMSPLDASKTGEDASVCGDCKHRGIPTDDPKAKQAKKRPCYVTLGQGPMQVFKALVRGLYKPESPRKIGKDRDVRVGTYGDPSAIPVWVWEELLAEALGWTGYTHQWKKYPELIQFCMASVDSMREKQQASGLGWRTFRIAPEGESLGEREIMCPSDKGVQCQDCMLCGGLTTKAKSIAIIGHGSGKKYL